MSAFSGFGVSNVPRSRRDEPLYGWKPKVFTPVFPTAAGMNWLHCNVHLSGESVLCSRGTEPAGILPGARLELVVSPAVE